jgi:methylenetetrahydrofolate reductase (NADPH)
MLEFPSGSIVLTVEVVPPRGPDAGPLLACLAPLATLPLQAFSVATNPVAQPHMSALALSSLIQSRTGKPAILHCTPRDHNRLSLQGLLWGGRALGIETVLIASGDRVSLREKGLTSVDDLDLFALIGMAVEAGFQVGVVLDPRPERCGLKREVERLRRKVESGARFAVTQPVYSSGEAFELAEAAAPIGVPVLLGILPLRTARHAEFLHRKVAGIIVPDEVRTRMAAAADPVATGLELARGMLGVARERFAGACLMPAFGHYELLPELLGLRPVSGA